LTTITNYSASLTYTFAPAGPSVNASGEVTGATAGTAYTVTAGTADCTSSSASFTNDVILPTPTITVADSSSPTLCSGSDGTIDLTFTNVTDGTYTINYDGGTFTNVVVSSSSATVTGLSSGNYNDLSITNTNTCTSSDDPDVSLSDPAAPAAPTAASPSAYCDGVTINDITATGAGSATFAWYSDAALTTLVDSDATFTPSGAVGTQTVYVTQTVAGCTSASTQVDVTVNATPAVPTLSSTAASCSAVELTTITNYSASLTYTFAPAGPSVNASGEVTGATAGTEQQQEQLIQ